VKDKLDIFVAVSKEKNVSSDASADQEIGWERIREKLFPQGANVAVWKPRIPLESQYEIGRYAMQDGHSINLRMESSLRLINSQWREFVTPAMFSHVTMRIPAHYDLFIAARLHGAARHTISVTIKCSPTVEHIVDMDELCAPCVPYVIMDPEAIASQLHSLVKPTGTIHHDSYSIFRLLKCWKPTSLHMLPRARASQTSAESMLSLVGGVRSTTQVEFPAEWLENIGQYVGFADNHTGEGRWQLSVAAFTKD